MKTGSVDTENINNYIDHHQNDGCMLYPRCNDTKEDANDGCPFRDCISELFTFSKKELHLEMKHLLKDKQIEEHKIYLKALNLTELAIDTYFKEA